MKKFALFCLFAVVGCGPSDSEVLEGRQAARQQQRDEEERKTDEQILALERKITKDKTEAALKRSEFEMQMAIQKTNRQLIEDRSAYEAAVKHAIGVIDKFRGIDPAADAMIDQNKEWYESYRQCESYGSLKVGTKTFSDWGPSPFRQTPSDEQLAVLHAFLDFVEQYRTVGKTLATEIDARATKTPESPSAQYKETYLKASEFVFTAANDREAGKHIASNMKLDETEQVLARRPLFPKGSGGDSQAEKESKLFEQ